MKFDLFTLLDANDESMLCLKTNLRNPLIDKIYLPKTQVANLNPEFSKKEKQKISSLEIQGEETPHGPRFCDIILALGSKKINKRVQNLQELIESPSRIVSEELKKKEDLFSPKQNPLIISKPEIEFTEDLKLLNNINFRSTAVCLSPWNKDPYSRDLFYHMDFDDACAFQDCWIIDVRTNFNKLTKIKTPINHDHSSFLIASEFRMREIGTINPSYSVETKRIINKPREKEVSDPELMKAVTLIPPIRLAPKNEYNTAFGNKYFGIRSHYHYER